MSPHLDDRLVANILSYVTEIKASSSCQTWKEHLYDALKLEPQVCFMRRILEEKSVSFCYNAVRPLGEDFEESVGYNFSFFAGGIYRLAWTRTYDAWSSQGEQHYGSWKIHLGHVYCETLEPTEEAGESEMRYAPAGYKFALPIHDILSAKGGYFQAKDGSKAAAWELPARTGKVESESIFTEGMWEPVVVDRTQESAGAPQKGDGLSQPWGATLWPPRRCTLRGDRW
ncbi:unnamed protein product [Durusdinium trenchii]|uniref:F-box domain-containing protein n=1 Tax=Durusdinium trenchii TaxID=1381693 RepID=A0ABP0NVV4_9DINO